jgi:hypothetical protein
MTQYEKTVLNDIEELVNNMSEKTVLCESVDQVDHVDHVDQINIVDQISPKHYSKRLKGNLIELYKEVFMDSYKNNMNIRIAIDYENTILYVEYIGHQNTDFADGQYFISIKLTGTNTWPFDSFPEVKFLTETGKFLTNELSYSSFNDNMLPMTLYSHICSIISMFHDKIEYANIKTTSEQRHCFALQSREYNMICNESVVDLFKTNGFPSDEHLSILQKYNAVKLSDNMNFQSDKLKCELDLILKTEISKLKKQLNWIDY